MSDRPERATAGNSGDSASSEAPSARPAGEAAAAARDYPELSGSSNEPAAIGSLDDPSPAAAPLRELGYRGLTVGLAVALVLVVALVGTAPFWSPLLPWSDGRAGVDPAFVERLNAEQQQVRQLEQQIATAGGAASQLEQRVGALEQKRAPSLPDLGEFRQQIAAASAGISGLTTRLERLENSAQSQTAGIAELKTGLEQLGTTQQAQIASLSEMTSRLNRTEQAQQAQATSLSDLTPRLDQIQKAEQAQAADVAATLGSLQQDLRAQQSAGAELRSRLQALEKTAQSRAGDLTDMGLTLALLQLRNAVEAGRPFPAEYDALSSLAKATPDIAAAAAALAAISRTGIANRVVLAQELRALGQKIDAVSVPAGADSGWTGAALDRLRGLVENPPRRGGRAEQRGRGGCCGRRAGARRRRSAARRSGDRDAAGTGSCSRRGLAAQGARAARGRSGAAAARSAAGRAARRTRGGSGLARLMRILLSLFLAVAAIAAGVDFDGQPRPGRDCLARLADRYLGRRSGSARRSIRVPRIGAGAPLYRPAPRAGQRPPLASGRPPTGWRGRADPRPRRPRGGRCG